jgi:hypothetical protein
VLLTLALLALGLWLWPRHEREPSPRPDGEAGPEDPAPRSDEAPALERVAALERRVREAEARLAALDPPQEGERSAREAARADLAAALAAVEEARLAERTRANRRVALRELGLGLGPLEEERALDLLEGAFDALARHTRRGLGEDAGNPVLLQAEGDALRLQWHQRLREALPREAAERIAQRFLPLR